MLFDITEEEFLEIRAEEMAEDLVKDEEWLDRHAKKIVEARAKEMAEERTEELERRAEELERNAKERAEEIAKEREQVLIRNIARSGVLPLQISQMTGLSEEQVRNYLS